MARRGITEYDLRAPEYRHINDNNIDEYEIRADGKVVRKDRWEVGFRRIIGIFDLDRNEFEIDDVVNRVIEIESEWKTMRASRSDRREELPDDYEV